MPEILATTGRCGSFPRDTKTRVFPSSNGLCEVKVGEENTYLNRVRDMSARSFGCGANRSINKKLLVTSASLLVTGALLVVTSALLIVTRSY